MIQSQLFRIENAKRPLAVLTLLVLLAALAALGQPRDARAQSPPEDVVLVSNVDQTAGDELTTETGRSSYAQSFTTGDHPDGYFLSSVDLGLSLAEGAEVKVELWRSHNSSHTPSVAIPRYYLMTLSGPSSVDDDTSTLELFSTNDVVLLPNWTYWIVVTRKGGDDEGLTLASTSTQDAIDPGGMSGFELRESVLLVDARLSELYAGDPTTGLLKEMELDPRIKIKLRGSEATRPPGPYATNRNLNPWAAAAETGDSITRYANSFTPDHHSFLLTPGANVSVNSFELTSVSLSVAAEEGVSPRVAIHLDDDGRPSANPIPNGTLTSPSALSRDLSAPGRAEFAASPALNLSKGTKYWVVIEANPGSGRLSIGTAADDELGRKLSEGTWHFGYKMKSWAGSSWIDDGQGRAFRISLNGTTDVEQGRLYVNSPQVGMGVTAYIEDATNQLISRVQDESWQWQRGDSKDGQFTDIPAEEGGTSGVYTPSASDLGKWLKATVTYNDGFAPGRSASAVAYHPVQSQPVVSNAGSQFPNVLDGYHLGTDLVNIAQAFTTGDKSSGYIFGGLRVGLDVDTNENELSWALHPDDGGHPAETPLFASVAVPPEGLDRDVKTLEELLHPGHRLEPGTKYWAVLTALSPGQARVQFEEATYAVDEGGEVEVTLSLTEEHDEALTVPILASGLGGADIDDYDGVPDSVTFEPGETSVSFRIGATDDDEAEDGERLHLSLGELPKGSHPGGPAQTIVYINEAGQAPAQGPTLRFGAQTYRVVEGETVEVTVVLSQPLANDLVVPIVATGQGGARPSDFTVSSSITVGAGETEQRFTFAAILDEGAELYEGFESVSLRFGELGGAVSAASRHAVQTTVIITDAFEAYFYEPALGVSAVNEWGDRRILYGPSGELDQGSEPGWSFDYMTLAKADSRSTEWIPFSRAIETHGKTVLRMSVLTYPQVTATFGQAEYEVAEGGSVEVTVSLSEDPQRSVTIPLSATGQDEADATDFEVPESITFDAGEQSKTVTISALQDEIDDDDETILLGFGATLPDGVTAGSPDRATVSIIDDDHPPVTVRFEQSAYEVDEGGSVVVAVTLSAAPEREVEIPLTGSPQGETDSGDFSGVPASLTFNADQTSRTFTFSATPDSIDDDGDSVLLGFGATLPDGVTAGSPDQATVSITDDDRPDSLTVRFQTANYSIIEGDSRTITVLLDDDPERSVVIPIRAEHEGGANPSDYSDLPASLTFNSGQTSRSFQLRAVEDQLIESGEQLRLRFDQLPPDVSAGDPAVALATLHDRTQGQNLPSPPTIHFAQASYTVAEGATLQITVTLSKAPGSEVEITLTGSPQGETTAADFSIPTSLTFGPAETSKTLTFAATPDSIDDDGDSVLLSFSNLPAGITTTPGSPDQATVSIIDDDHPPVTVRFEQSAYEVDEGGSVVVAVTLSAAPEREVEIPLTGSPQGETDSGDFSGVPASLTFNADQTSRTFTFSATDDLLDDDGDSVLLGFGATLPDGVTAGSPDRATVSIIDDDDPPVTVRFEQSAYEVDEGGSVVVAVTLSAAPEREVEIPLTGSPQGETDSGDFSGVPASLTFNADQTSRTFTFSATDDLLDDDGDSVLLGFGSTLPDGVTAGSPDQATVSITDDDRPDSLTVRFQTANYSIIEGDSRTITVLLDDDPERSVVIPIRAEHEGGANPSDYSDLPASLTFNSGQTSRSFQLRAVEDQLIESGEQLRLRFDQLPPDVSAGDPAVALATLHDRTQGQNLPSPPTIHFAQASYTVAEGATLQITVTLSKAPGSEVEITLTGSPQGETTAADFSIPTSLTFGPAETSKTLTFAATPDSIDDDGDSVLLSFSNLPAGITTTPGSPDQATVSIIDDDHPPVTVRFEQSAYEVDEGGSVVVAVTLSAAPEREVEIPLTGSPQGETDSGDFSGVPASLTFNADQTSRTFTFSATDDLLDDDGDSVLLGFGATLPDGVTAGSPDRATVSIIDDDDPPVTVRFEQSAYEVDEGGSVVVAVTLSAAPEREVEIPLTGSPQGETDSGDFSGVPASLTFNADQTSRTFTFSATDDLLDDDGDSVLLGFGSTLPDGVTAGSPDQATVSITDDDRPDSLTVRFQTANYSIIEGDSRTITVLLDDDPERSVVIPIRAEHEGGANPSDYSDLPASLTFNSGQTSRSFQLRAVEDQLIESGEQLRLRFDQLPPDVSAGDPAVALATLHDRTQGQNLPSPPTIHFAQASYTVAEGATLQITVTLSKAPGSEVEITLTGSPQGETTAADFSIPTSLTFGPAETSKTLTFAATPDSIDDDGDSVLLSFSNLPAGITTTPGSPDQATVSIIDDDHPPVTVRFEQSAYEVDEGGSVVVAVTLSAAPEREVEIPLTGSPQGETDSGDFSGVPASLTFNADQTSRTFTFSATDDLLDDDGDSVLLGFGATLPDGVTAGSPDRATVSIIDDDDPPVTVRFEQSAYEVDEGGSVVVAVTLSAAPEREVEIPLTGSPQGETDSGDFSGVPASLTFNADQTSRTFTFSATDDLLDDDGDSVLLGFGSTLPDGVTAGSPDQATVSITDDDRPDSLTVRFQTANYSIIEGDSRTITVLLDDDPERSVVIPIRAEHEGGANPSDYSDLPASLTFNSGQTSRSFQLRAVEDQLIESGEQLRLRFDQLPPDVSAGDPAVALATLHDRTQGQNLPSPPTIHFAQASYTVAEGATLQITVTLSKAPGSEVEITLTGSPQGETTAADFSIPTSLTFGPAETSKTLTFAATPDSIDDDGDSVLLSFSNLPAGITTTPGSPDQATVSIIDDDHPPVTVRFEQSAYEVDEGGSVVVAVTLSAAPEREVEIPLTGSPQGETDSGDFSGVPASLTFNADQTSRTFTFSATDDLLDDDGDSVLLGFGATLPDGVTAGSPDRATVSIIDDDDPPVTVRFEQSAYEVDEGGSVVVAVTLSAAPEREVEIPLTGSPQGETDSGDFSGVPASLTFNADQTSRTFTFSATDDLLDDDGDSVLLGFGSTLPDGVTAGSPDQATVSITDDDRPDSLTVRFQTANYSIIEGDSRTITVLLDDDPERSVVIPIRAEHEGGANPSDYSDLPASLTFNSGQTSRSFQLRAVEDQLIESGEQLRLRFDQLPPDVSAGDPAVALATLHDRTQGQNLPSPPTIHFAQASYTVAEGATLQITVTLSKAPGSEVEITLTGSPQGETTAADFSIPTSLTFGPAETSKTLTFAATPDSIDDDGDSVLLSFSNLPAGITTTPGSPDQATVSIIDDDHPPVTVRFEQSAYEVDEGGSVVVAVTLSAAPEREVEIPLTGSPQGETDSGDFSGVPASLTFNADQTSRTFTFSANDDLLDDDGDSVLLGFGATLPDGVTAGSPDRATVSIIDDDHPPVTVRFEQSAYEVDEGGSVVVAVTLSAAPEREVEIPLTGSPQGETDSGDFSGVPASLTFNADQTSRTFTFSATDDLLDDDGDSVLLGFGSTLPDGVTAGSPDQATVSITDDDRPDSLTVRFQTANYSIIEGDSRTITVLLDDDPERSVVIPIRAEHEGGANPSDYSDLPASLTFNSGQTSRSFQLRAVEDQLIESGEQLRLRFDQLPPDVSAGDPAVALATLHDRTQGQNLPSPPTIHFAQASYTVAEGATLQITVTLSKAPGSEVEITLTGSPQGETTAADFSIPTSLTFGPAETSKTLTFAATPDSIDDDGDSVLLSFSNLPAGITTTPGSPDQATVSIIDDDHPPVTVRFEQSAYEVDEGGSVVVAVTLSAAPEREVEIPLTGSPQGETDSGDFSGVPASLTFNADQTSRTFTFSANDDLLDDDGDSVLLTFGATLPDGVTAGSPDRATVSIIDDDHPPVTVRFEQSAYEVDEGGSVVVAVTLSAAPEREVEIPLTGSPQGETDSGDFSGVPASLTFNADQTSRTFTFSATDDLLDDDGDSVLLGFGSTLPDGVTAGSPDQATVSITDDDRPDSLTVRFQTANYSIIEGDSRTITVLLDDDPERSVVIPIRAEHEGGANPSDYSDLPASLTFNSGQTSRSFQLRAVEDQLIESGEQLRLRFDQLPPDVSAGDPAVALATLHDRTQGQNLPSPPTIHFAQASYTVAEGATLQITVTLSKAPGSEVEITLTGSPQGETTAADFSIPTSLTFGPAETSKTLTFAATPDSIDDDGDSVLLSFSNLPAGITTTPGSPDQATVSIIDDDHPPVTVRFEQSAYEVDEGGSVVVAVTLSAAPEREVEIPLTGSPQGETDSGDFSGVPASLTFNADQTSRTFTFSATDDLLDDDGDSVLLGFGATLPDGVTAGSPDRATVSIIDDDHPPVTVRFEQSAYEVDEGGSVVVAVTLSAAPEREVEIPLTGSPQGETDSGDFSGVPASLTFNADQTSRTFTFSANDDLLDDDGDSVLLGFGATLPDGVTAGSPDRATVSIIDDDDPPVTVRFEQSAYEVDEGGSVVVAVTLSAAPEREVEIPLTGSPQGETDSGDFSGVPASLTFNADQTSRTFTFSATDDLLDDDGDSVLLGFGATLPDGVTAGSPDRATVSIIDDDHPPVTVRFEQSAYEVDEGGSVVVAVTLSAAPEREVEIPLTGSPQGETDSGDFSGVPASLTFNADQTSRTFTFSATDDLLDDDGDSVLLGFGSTLPDGVTAGSPDRATVSIIDDDHPPVTVRFEQSAYEVDEGGSVVVAVTLSAAPEREVEIPLTGSPQGETDSGDFSGVPASLTFNADQTSRTFTFSATPDSIDDDGDSVLLGFGATLPDGVTAGSPDRATVSIIDDDDPPVTVRFEQSAYEVDEGGSVVVAVTLSAAPEREVEIPLTGSPQGETDSGDFSGVPASLTFNADQTSRTFTFSATDDLLDDDGDSVLLGFGATLPDGVTAGSPDRATVSIIDDDHPPVTVRFEQSAYEVDEGGSVVVAVTLSAAPEREVEIPLTGSPQGETDSGDFSGVPASLTFNADQTSRTFTFSATDDLLDDDGDSVLLGFGSTLPDGVTAGSPDRATVSIIDDDHPPVTVRFEQSAYEVDEGGSVVVAVTLSAAPEREVEIPLTGSPQGETDSGDFSGVPASLTFNADQTSRTFTFSATPDSIDDDGDSVLLGFGATLPDGVTAGSPDRATVSIIDDDDPPVTVRFEQSAYEVDEGGSVVVAVTLSAAPEREVEIPLTGSPQGETDSGDFSGVPASLTFNADQTSRTFTFSATPDSIDDDGDSVLLGFGATLPDGVTAGSPDRATVSIIDDDDPPVTVRFEQSAYEVDEGGSVVVAVTLSAAPEREVEIPLTGSPQGETDSGDFSGVPASLTFNADQTSRTFTFSATDDLLDDDGDSVLLGFGATLPDGVTAGSPDRATVSIIDDDHPPVTVSFATSVYQVPEGGSVAVTVILSEDPERSVAIPLTTTHLGSAGLEDYSGVPANLTFHSGETTRSFNVSAHEDDVNDEGESIRLGFEMLPSGVSEGPTSSTTIAITQPAVWVDGTLRLVNGETFTADGRPCDGRLEIFIDGSWGTICDDYWTKENADVACRALGFAAGSVDNVLRFSSARFGRGSGDIVLDDVSCSGDEFGMLDCPRRGNIAVGTHNCRHSEDVGVRCLKEAPPRVVNIEVSEPPGDNGRYDAGETVEITLIWNVPVKVTTPQGGLEPKVWIVFDDGMQTLATYSRGSGTYRTVFVHRLTYLNRDGLPNESYETVRVVADTLQERGGSIRSVGLGLPPVLQHLGYPEIRDTAAPATIVTPPQFNDAGADATWSVGDTIEVTFNFNFPVVVDTADGTPFATILLGGDTLRQSTYLRGSGTNQLVFAYALTESDGTHDVLIVQPNVLMLNGGTIRDQIFNLDASLVHWHAAQIASAQTVGPGSTSAPLTASIENDPGSHDGSSAFTFELHFSEEVQLSSATLRNAAFSVSGGQVTNAQPQSEASTRWTVTVQPTGNESVTIALPATTDCTSAGAVCTSDGRPLVAPVQLVVPRSFALQFFQANSPATGAPEIVGTPQVEQTLTAQTTGITDDDGMEDATIAYQWMRHNPDSLSDEEISGATVVTYTVTAQDRGSALRVRTTFTDDAGNHESLTSLPTAMIPRLPLTATIVNASPTHDGHSVYTFELRLSEDLVSDFSFRTLRDYAFLVSGGDVTRARRLDRPGNMRWEISIQPDSDGELYITLPSTTDCAYLNALCTPDGRRQSSRLELIVPGPNGN